MASERQFYVYIMTNEWNTTLYVGVTSDLMRRVYEHRTGADPGFTHRYKLSKLVYYEVADNAVAAIEREKHLKGGSRARKAGLINSMNPVWADLYESL